MGRDEMVDESVYTPSIVRLSGLGQASPAGLGLLVSPTEVVTCAHVVNAALGRELAAQAVPEASDRIEVSFPLVGDGEAVRRGRVVAWMPPVGGAGGGDVAGLLLLGGLAPDGAEPGRFANAPPQPGAGGRVFGYPGDDPDWTAGKWVDVDVKGAVGGGLIQVESRGSQTVKAQPGYSGSPVWDPRTGTAVGLLQIAAFPDRPERDAYLLAPRSIAESWEEPFDYILVPDNPYRGLESFTSDDRALFFGRDSDISELIAMVRDQPVVVAVGPSGVGKSSLVQAGLVAVLREQGRSVALVQPERDPWHRLAAGLIRARDDLPVAEEVPQEQIESLITRLRAEGFAPLAQFLRSQDRPLLVVVDQFEELLAAGSPDRRLIDLLLPPPDAAEDAARVVLTLRTDFLPALQSIAGVQLNGRMYFVSPLDAEQMRQAVDGPATARGVTFEEGLADRIVRDAGGALPLLAFTLNRLWETQRHATLTFGGYRSIGEVTGVLDQVAEKQMAQLTGTTADRLDQALLRLVRVTPDGPSLATRQRVLPDDVTPEEWEVLQLLGNARLVFIDADPANHDKQYAELAHESLITAWQRLHDLVTENQDFLNWLARMRPRVAEGDPLPPARIEEARVWLTKRPADIPAAITSFVQSSKTAAEARLHELQDARDRAERAREQAEQAANRAEALRLAAAAELALHGTQAPTIVALALGTESVLTEPTLQGDLALRHVMRLHPRTWPELDHDDAVHAVAFSPDGSMLATGSGDCSARVFDPFAGRQLARLDHDGPVHAVAFSPDGMAVATASADFSARVFGAVTGIELARLDHGGAVDAVAFSPDGTRVATASADFSARIFASATGKQLVRLEHDGPVTEVAFSADGAMLATGSSDRSARIFHPASGAELARLDHDGPVHAVAFSPDGARIATASGIDASAWLLGQVTETYSARVFGAFDAGGTALSRLNHDGPVQAVAFSPDGTVVATASADFTARVFRPAAGAELARLDHDGPVNAVAFSPDSAMLATASGDRSARVFDLATRTELARLDHDSAVNAVAFSPDGLRIAIASAVDKSAWLLDPVTGTHSARVSEAVARAELGRLVHDSAVNAVAFGPDGSRVATASADFTARVFDPATGAELGRLVHDSAVHAVAFGPDGSRVATASADFTARVFDPATGTELSRLVHDGPVHTVAFSPDGGRVATASADFTARVFELFAGRQLAQLDHDNPVHMVVFSPDGARVATASGDRWARVFDPATGAALARLVHDSAVNAVAFSPDGSRVATASADFTARVFDAATGTELSRLVHDGPVYTVTFSRDGSRVAAASGDRSARVFDPATGTELSRLEHDSPVHSVAFSPDGTHIVTASQDNMARLYEISPDLLLRRALALMTRPLNASELRRYSLSLRCRHVEQRQLRPETTATASGGRGGEGTC